MDFWTEKRILCVDDSEDICDLFSTILVAEGYEVRSAQSCKSALQQLNNTVFNLCLIDLSLSDGDGLELIQTIRAMHPSTAIVVCSGDDRLSTREEANQFGVQAFLIKPISYELLLETVTQLIGQAGVKSELSRESSL